jgi:MoaA/NifB/PqqE/SkfB family radical SAM enzyme
MAFLSASPVLRPLKKLRVRAGCLDGLRFLWLEITRRCNLACAHCYASSGPHLPITERMRFHDWCRVMDDARATGCGRLQFIGGEPTVHPDLTRLVEHATRAGFKRCEVFTNATLVREDLVQTFKNLGVLVHFSFYSFDPAVHDRITGQEGSFQRTVEGIRQLVRQRVRLTAEIILLPENAAHLRKTRKFLRDLGVDEIGTDRVRGVGRGEQFVARARPLEELCGRCWSGKLCIDADGDAHPCVFSRFATVGNVLDEGLGTIIAGARLRAFRHEMFLGNRGGRTWTRNAGQLLP